LSKVEQSAKRTSGTFSAMKTTAISAGAALGIAGLAKGVSTSVQEFREAQKVGAQTNAVLKSTAGVAKVSAREVGNLATAISNKTGIDDEAIQKGENLLLTFKNVRNEAGRGRDIFNQATRAAVDLSAAGFGSLESTSKQLGKALNDPVKGLTALGRSGVTFSEQQKTAINALVATGTAADRVRAQQIILKEVQSQVGGSAAAQATNADKLRVALGNLAESAGSVLVPAIDKAAAVLLKVNSLIGPAGWLVLIGVLGTVGTSIFAVVAAWKVYTAVTALATAATEGSTAALIALRAAMAVSVVGALVLLGVALVTAYKKSETFRDIVNAVGRALMKAFVTPMSAILGALSSMLGAVGAVARAVGADGLAKKAEQGQAAIDDLRQSLNNLPGVKTVDVAVKIKLDGQDVDVSKAKPLSPTPPGGDGPGVIGSRINDLVRANGRVKDGVKALVADGLGSMIPGIGAGGGGGGSLGGAKAIMRPFAAVGAHFGLHVSSGLRPGAITSSGNKSLHSTGNAIDLANGNGPDAAKMAAFNALRSRYGSRLAELIYSPAGGRQIKNGQNFFYTGAVRADHFDHVHVGFLGDGPGVGGTGDGTGSLSGINLAIDAARKAGFTGEALVRMVAIAGRESNYNPGAQNLKYPDHSIGLWQINQLAHHGRFGTDAQLKNPYTNARAAWILSGHGHNFNPWSTNRGLSAALIKRARAAVAAFGGATSAGGAGNSAAGSTSTSGAASGAAGTVEKVNPFDQKIASADLAIQQAQTGKASTRTFQKVAAMVAKRKLIGKRIASIRKALKGKLSAGKRLALTQELTQRLQEHAQLGTDIQGLVHPAATVGGGDGGSIGDVGGVGDGGDPNQALIDSNNALQASIDAQVQAEKEHTDALNAVRDEIKRQTDLNAAVQSTEAFQLKKYLADVLSGQMGGFGVAPRAYTPGSGVSHTY